MRTLVASSVLVALIAVVAEPGRAATQTILGGTLDVRSPSPGGDPARRRVLVNTGEDVGTPNLVVGDPTVGGATLRLVVRGDGGSTEQTFDLPAAGWKSYITMHDWPVYMGFRYTNTATGGAVRLITIERAGFASPEGKPPPTEPHPGKFRMRVRIYGRDGAVDVLPPNPGTEGGIELTLGGGDTYCALFGGTAGGRVMGNTSTRFTVRTPVAEGCP